MVVLIFVFINFFFVLGLETIGMSLPGKWLPKDKEEVLLDYTISEAGDRGMISFFWMTSTFKDCENIIMRFYIDGEKTPIEFPAYLALGTGQDKTAMYGSEYVGKGAKDGGIYSTIRFPFFKNIKVSVIPPDDGVYWFIVRGLVGNDKEMPSMPVVQLGELSLPPTTTIHVSRLEDKKLDKLERVSLLKTTSPTAILMTNLQVDSNDANFLEGCFRAFTPDGKNGQNRQLLSSGTEDYFQSAFYFDGGKFAYPGAGITFWDGKNATMYKFHVRDYMVFQDGVDYMWRNGEDTDPKTKLKCGTNTEPGFQIHSNLSPSTINTIVWYYTW